MKIGKSKGRKMIDKKYSIFISSTYKDLKEIRENLHDRIIKAGHFPLAMENFPASDKTQWNIIQPLIDKCDYFLLIVGFHYGSIDEETKLSYTEKEYEYALEIDKPILSFVIDETAIDEKNENINKFRKKVLENNKNAILFPEINNLIIADVITSLNKAFKDTPQKGWIRTDEFDRLQQKYNNLQHEYNQLLKPNDLDDCDCLDKQVSLNGHILDSSLNRWYGKDTFKNIFVLIAKQILDYFPEDFLYTIITRSIEFGNDIPEYNINLDSKSKMLIRNKFAKLNLIVLSDKKINNKSTIFWKITDKGKNYFYTYEEIK